MPPVPPPRWTAAEIAVDAQTARALFRHARLDEPRAHWIAVVDEAIARLTRLFDEFGMIDPSTATPERLAAVFTAGLDDELRYFAGPPISADDLKVLAEATSLAPSVLSNNSADSQRVLETILATLDPKRFPWVAEQRPPTAVERETAILASAILLARQKVQTVRANEGKNAQELAVKDFLRGMGFVEVATRPITTLDDAPLRGQFCGETTVGTRKADVPVRLFDGRLMPIECKVSNSAVNSVKRLNNDAAAKARTWLQEFGTQQIVPSAMLSGVFEVHNVIQAQDAGLTIFWAHRLDAMQAFIHATR